MTSPFTLEQMGAQETESGAHADLVRAERARAIAAASAHETGLGVPASIVAPPQLAALVAYISGTRQIEASGLVQAIGHAGPEPVLAMTPAASALATPVTTIGTVKGPSFDGSGKQLAIRTGMTALLGAGADWSLFVVARFPVDFSAQPVLPIIWHGGTALWLFLSGVDAKLSVHLQTTAGSYDLDASIVPAQVLGTTTLIELECRAGVLTLRMGATTPVASSKLIAGNIPASSTLIRVGSDGVSNFATMVLGEVVSFDRALSAADLQAVRRHAQSVFGALVAG